MGMFPVRGVGLTAEALVCPLKLNTATIFRNECKTSGQNFQQVPSAFGVPPRSPVLDRPAPPYIEKQCLGLGMLGFTNSLMHSVC